MGGIVYCKCSKGSKVLTTPCTPQTHKLCTLLINQSGVPAYMSVVFCCVITFPTDLFGRLSFGCTIKVVMFLQKNLLGSMNRWWVNYPLWPTTCRCSSPSGPATSPISLFLTCLLGMLKLKMMNESSDRRASDTRRTQIAMSPLLK